MVEFGPILMGVGYLSQKFDQNDSFFGASHLISENRRRQKKNNKCLKTKDEEPRQSEKLWLA